MGAYILGGLYPWGLMSVEAYVSGGLCPWGITSVAGLIIYGELISKGARNEKVLIKRGQILKWWQQVCCSEKNF